MAWIYGEHQKLSFSANWITRGSPDDVIEPNPAFPKTTAGAPSRGVLVRLKHSARNSALKGDTVTLEAELTAATELWPLNPELREMSKEIFKQGDVQAKAAFDFDQLLGQKNLRQIYEKRVSFIGMLALDPERSKKLEDVLKDMQAIETAIFQASAMAVQTNYAGAWESVEKVAGQFPDDSKLSQTRADLTTKASKFVDTLRSAQDLEKKEQIGSSLALYLKAQKIYPQSDYANEGIDRLVKRILPQG